MRKRMKSNTNIKIMISGGGTGGHIFPALSIANEIKRRYASADILFVGARGRMEMERIPAAGFTIIGLPVKGFIRKLSLKNLVVLFLLVKSIWMARSIVKSFSPGVVVGVGGYASGPVLRVASRMGIPTLIQEQNSYAGITNKLLAKRVNKICVAYERMERFFPKEKLVLTGNPVRNDFKEVANKTNEARKFFNIQTSKVLFITGGSLGARMINEAVLQNFSLLLKKDITLIWQTGSLYLKDIKNKTAGKKLPNIQIFDFISRMDLAFAASNLIVSRAGAITIAEITVAGKPSILVPSPNVAEDHQTKNAQALVDKGATLMIPDNESKGRLIKEALELINNQDKLDELATNSKKLSIADAEKRIVDEVVQIIS